MEPTEEIAGGQEQQEEPAVPAIEDVIEAPAPSLISERRRWMEATPTTTSTPASDAVVADMTSQRRERSRSRGRGDDEETREAFLAERTAISKYV